MSCSGPSHEVISNEKIQKLRESLDALLSGHNALQKLLFRSSKHAFDEYILSTALNKHPTIKKLIRGNSNSHSIRTLRRAIIKPSKCLSTTDITNNTILFKMLFISPNVIRRKVNGFG